MVKTLDNVFMGVIFVVGIILTVISTMVDKSASNFPTCYSSKARNALRLILVLGVIFAVSSISFAICQFKCAPCEGISVAFDVYVGIALVLSAVITGLAASLNKELDATKCPDASKMATGMIGMGVTSLAFCIGISGYQGYENYKKNKKPSVTEAVVAVPPPPPPAGGGDGPIPLTSAQQQIAAQFRGASEAKIRKEPKAKQEEIQEVRSILKHNKEFAQQKEVYQREAHEAQEHSTRRRVQMEEAIAADLIDSPKPRRRGTSKPQSPSVFDDINEQDSFMATGYGNTPRQEVPPTEAWVPNQTPNRNYSPDNTDSAFKFKGKKKSKM
jgi:hypothetical protein